MLQHRCIILLVIRSSIQLNQFLYLHLFEDAFLIDAGEVIVVPIAVRLYLWYKGIIETEGSILAFDTGIVIHCVVSFKDGGLLARELFCVFHSSLPVFRLAELGHGSFFEIYELCCYFAQFVRHLYG